MAENRLKCFTIFERSSIAIPWNRPLTLELDLQICASAIYLTQIANLSKTPFSSSLKFSMYCYPLLYFWPLSLSNLRSAYAIFFYSQYYYLRFSHACLPHCFGLIHLKIPIIREGWYYLTILAKADCLLPFLIFKAIHLST